MTSPDSQPHKPHDTYEEFIFDEESESSYFQSFLATLTNVLYHYRLIKSAFLRENNFSFGFGIEEDSDEADGEKVLKTAE